MECYQASHRLSDYQFPTCEYCGKEITEKSHKKGGLHQWDNVQLACRRCNWEKGDQMSST